MALIGEMHYLTIGGNTYSIPISGGSTVTVTRSLTSGTKSATISVDGTNYDLYAPTPNAGTVTSVRVQATSPVQSSTSTAQSSTLNTTISLASGYGDTQNPYASKTKNYVLAAPSTANGVPTFRALVAADIPDLSSIYLSLTGGQVTGPVTFGDSVSIDEATVGDLVVNGSASFTNNINANTINGVTVGSSPKFTDTVTTVSTSGSGNAVTAITASNGALTVTKGTTFLTSHQDISGKADKTATVSNVAYDSTNAKITKTINGTTSDVVTVATLKSALGSMPASDVYSWAKASTKPSYTASEVGAATSSHTHGNITNAGDITATAPTIASGDQIIINDHSASKITNGPTFDGSTTTTALTPKGTWESFSKFSGSYADLTNKPTIPTVPSNVSAFTNDAGYITSADVPEGASAYTGTISAVSTAASNGTNNGFARGDHVHNITKTTINSVLGTGSGTTKFYREDGTWATPAYTTNTDAKLQVAEVTSATQYYPLVGTGTTAATRQYDTTGFKYKGTNGTTSAVGSAILELGNSTGSGTANNKQAQLIMYGSNTKKATITLAAPSADIALALPTSGGTLALTSQIPTVSYPVTSVNSKTGAVSLTASDVGALASNTTYVSTVTTTAGTHSAISSKSGAVSFNVPTKTSHLTNDSGFITTDSDQKLALSNVSTETTGTTRYPIIAANSTSAATRQYDSTGFSYTCLSGGTGTGNATLTLGNNTATGTSGNKQGKLIIYGSTAYAHTIQGAPTAARTLTLPNNTGTIALTDDIPTKVSDLTNDSGFITSYTNTWRTIQVNDSDILSGGTGSGKLNLKAGTGITLSDSNGTVTITNSSTNTDTLMTQTYSATNNSYPVLMTATAGISSTASRGATTSLLTNSIYGNPATGNLVATKFNNLTLTAATTGFTIAGGTTSKTLTVSGTYTLGAACEKGIVTSVDTSANLPTSNAVKTFVEGKGYITSYTDEKMKWTASTSSNTYYPLQSTSTATTSTANTLNSISFYQYYNTGGGYRQLILGNSTAHTSTGGAYGSIRLYGTKTYYGDLYPGPIDDSGLTANRTWTLPNKTGTIALTSDILTKTSELTNDIGFITSYTDNKVTQTETTDSNNYEVLFSGTADSTTRTEGARKSSGLLFYPAAEQLTVSGRIVTPNLVIGDADALSVDSDDDSIVHVGSTASKTIFHCTPTIAGHSTAIGYRMSNNGTKSLSSGNSPVAISAEVQLTAGTWLLIAAVDFPYTTNTASVKGVRHIAWYQGSSALNDTRITVPAYSNIQGFNTRLQSTTTAEISSTTNFYIYGFQDSDATMSVNYYWQALRIL